jgi:hypothetical protein
MSATPDSTLADPQQIIADLQRQLVECRVEGTRFEPSVPIATVSLHSRGGEGAAGRSRACKSSISL